MRRHTLLLGSILVIMLVAGCTQSSGPGNDSAPTGSTDDNTVVFANGVFTPATVTIEQGETVTWVNQGSSRMWVATDVHPTHTEYDGTPTSQHCAGTTTATFDQCNSGASYSFTFDKTGVWSYHNHVGPGTGTVIVE